MPLDKVLFTISYSLVILGSIGMLAFASRFPVPTGGIWELKLAPQRFLKLNGWMVWWGSWSAILLGTIGQILATWLSVPVLSLAEWSIDLDVATVSAATALVAVIVSPVVSIWVVKSQIRASVVSVNRQKWIDQLRDQISELVNAIKMLDLQKTLEAGLHVELTQRAERLSLLQAKVDLLLNPNESDHRELSSKINEAIRKVIAREPDVHAMTQAILRQSQIILKREWQRVKMGN